jgi:UDP-N-acetylglucosamine:LPS N-acetylglucosamine transferase
MRACDIAVQNAGGLTSLEAMASELPVITYRCLPGHGRANAAVLDKAGQVRWVRKPEDLASALIPSIKRSEPVIGIGDPTELLLSLAEQVPSTKKATKRKATG